MNLLNAAELIVPPQPKVITGNVTYGPASIVRVGANTVAAGATLTLQAFQSVGVGNGFRVEEGGVFLVRLVTNTAPTIVTVPQAVTAPTVGALVAVSVLGADDGGEANLIYTWDQTAGPALATFPSGNGRNAGKAMTGRFPQAGTYDFTVEVEDAEGLSASATCSITVTVLRPEVPHAIYACGSDYAYFQQSINAVSPTTGTLTYTIATAPTHGTVTIVDDINFRYVPATSFSGVDTFAITASDGSTTSLPGVITMTVGIDPRRSMLVRTQATTPFDAQRWLTDIAYVESHLAARIPGRVWETAAGALAVPMLRVVGPASLNSTINGSVMLQAQTQPYAPVTFTATANGQFGIANTITTTANDAGLATVSFTSPPVASRCPVLIGSPAAVGTQRIVVEVQP